MKKKKIRVRYRLSILYFIVGICISLFALFQLLGVYNAYLGELKDRERSNYASEVELLIRPVNVQKMRELFDVEKALDLNVNIKIPQILLKSNNCLYSWYCDIIVGSHIPEHIWLTNGQRLTFSENSGERLVAAGRNRIENARVYNGKQYLDLQDQTEFQLDAVIGMAQSDYQDGYLIIRYQDIPESWYSLLVPQNTLTLRLQSDAFLSDEIINGAAAVIYEKWPDTTVSAARLSNVQTAPVGLRTSRLSIPVWIYLFCLLILVQVSMFWIRERKKEILIRKIMGFSDLQIWKTMASNVFQWMIVSILIYLLVQLGINAVFGISAVSFLLEPENILIAVLYLIITMVVCTTGPLLAIRRISAAEALNQWGD